MYVCVRDENLVFLLHAMCLFKHKCVSNVCMRLSFSFVYFCLQNVHPSMSVLRVSSKRYSFARSHARTQSLTQARWSTQCATHTFSRSSATVAAIPFLRKSLLTPHPSPHTFCIKSFQSVALTHTLYFFHSLFPTSLSLPLSRSLISINFRGCKVVKCLSFMLWN